MLKKLKLLLCLCLLHAGAWAQLPISLNHDDVAYGMAGQVHVLEDKDGGLGIDEILHPSIASRFEEDSKDLSFGFTASTYWVRMRMRNDHGPLDNWLLEIAYPLLDDITLYYLDEDGLWQQKHVGDGMPFYNREVVNRNFLLPLHFVDRSPHVFYLRVKTTSSMRLPMNVLSRKLSYDQSLESELMYGLYYGLLLVMIIYNLFIYFTLNDASYLYYVLSIFFTLALFGTLNGHAFQYLWFDSVWAANHTMPIAMGGLALGAALFARTFLEVKKYSSTLYKMLTAVIVTGCTIPALDLLFGQFVAVVTGIALLGIDSVLLLTTGFICWRRGNLAARYFVLAWVGYLIGGLMIVFLSYGLLPHHPFFAHAVEVGSAFEVTLLAIALSDKYSIIRKEKDALQEAMLKDEREAKALLEKRVNERTHEINVKREEIERKNTRLEKQNKEINQQKDKIESSIRYAQRIQRAMLPSDDEIQRILPDSFVFYMPRDIVSGDFYWISDKNGKIVVAAADCTGHGVPGAFMSVLGSNLLNEIVNSRGITSPDMILYELNEGVRLSLSQDSSQNKDGMEIGICCIDRRAKTLEFAGANSPLLYSQGTHLEFIKGNSMPIGGSKRRYASNEFKKHSISIAEPTVCYLFSDGFRDQFGGSNGEKFMMKRFKSLLRDICQEPIEAQEIIITRTFKDWIGKGRQIDDVLLMGFRA